MRKVSLRGEIIKALCGAFPREVSGERLAQGAQVSRVAVWKEMHFLKEQGFPIEASRTGYRLRELPDSLWGEYLEALLSETFTPLQVVSFGELSSTNTKAKILAQDGYPEGTLVVAEYQTQGRGRLGRGWFAERGKSLTFSLLLRPPIEPEMCPSLGLLTALLVAFTLEEFGFSPTLKWPNDLYLQGKKVAGILLESSTELDRIEWIVVGIGLNVNVSGFPEELQSSATSLFLETGKLIKRWELLRSFLSLLGREYPRFLTGKSFAPWIEAFSLRFPLLGKEVEILQGQKRLVGRAQRINEQGALVIEREGKEEIVRWGEVSLRSFVNL
ncbi:MAG: biotin--[acetyl-CoA-carboxylase] ligase [Candidatus Caldatribacteriaceae bacterium]